MLEKQFADFLTAQMKSKVELLERETDHAAAKELRLYVEQLGGLFQTLLHERSTVTTRMRRTKNTPHPQE
ncbi:hypothetical protein [Alicyclobacillus dauci]|uniref:Uncharacterized protein n=1 Tax=Alicyclobacillus dauci TaxID=1475485 RepID=A0ABY6Z739_9BACL|nr:hypothetical protein [Alicyclobacillus dauci]WAH38642.1 hypothetical protein NZD86_09230 [Alicyclobacillus dauci]